MTKSITYLLLLWSSSLQARKVF